MSQSKDTFFVGWAPASGDLRTFLMVFSLCLLGFFGGASFMIAATQSDPGEGAVVGGANAIGLLEAKPYPVLHVLGSNFWEPGETVLLSGGGKRGVQDRAEALDGEVVSVAGGRLERGDLHGLQLRGGKSGMKKSEMRVADPIEPISLGRWRITGEICDGKCYIGAMRPGEGLAHKACANLCLSGGVPPVFVATDEIEGSEYFLLGNANGEPLSDAILDYSAILVEIEGRVEKRGTLNVFLIDEDSLTVAK